MSVATPQEVPGRGIAGGAKNAFGFGLRLVDAASAAAAVVQRARKSPRQSRPLA